VEMERANNNLTENNLLEYHRSMLIHFFCILLPGTYLRRNSSITNGIELNPNTDKGKK
jgi:hypothetical protein